MNNNRTPGRKKTNRDSFWNISTVILLLSTFCACGYFFSLYRDPYSELNFFPPDTPTVTPIPPTITPIALPPTWTPTVTLQPIASNTRRPTFTLEPSITPFTLATATSELTATITPKPTGAPYGATISYYDTTTFRFSKPRQVDCTQMLIGGQVFNAKNEPVIGAVVKMGGALPGKSFPKPISVLSGLAKDYYGDSGFEFNSPSVVLEPVASEDILWVQLFKQDQPESAPVFVKTYKDCKRNLVLITFKEK